MKLSRIITIGDSVYLEVQRLCADWWNITKDINNHDAELQISKHEKYSNYKRSIYAQLPSLGNIVKSINGYKKFNELEYHFNLNNNQLLVKFQPAGTNVSFWTAKFEDVILKNNYDGTKYFVE